MKNKRGTALAAFIFVLLVFTTCLFILQAFISSKGKISEGLLTVGAADYFNVEWVRAHMYLKILSEQAIIESYKKSIDYFSKRDLQGTQERFFDKEEFNKKVYADKFTKYFKDVIISKLADYPSLGDNEEMKEIVKGALVSFDGDNLSVVLQGHTLRYAGDENNDAQYTFSVSYDTSLSKMGLINLEKFAHFDKICDYSNFAKGDFCLEESFPGFVAIAKKQIEMDGENYLQSTIQSKKKY